MLNVLLVSSVELRPVLILNDNGYASSDLIELYTRIINSNRVVKGVYKTVDKDEVLSALRLLSRYKHCSVR